MAFKLASTSNHSVRRYNFNLVGLDTNQVVVDSKDFIRLLSMYVPEGIDKWLESANVMTPDSCEVICYDVTMRDMSLVKIWPAASPLIKTEGNETEPNYVEPISPTWAKDIVRLLSVSNNCKTIFFNTDCREICGWMSSHNLAPLALTGCLVGDINYEFTAQRKNTFRLVSNEPGPFMTVKELSPNKLEHDNYKLFKIKREDYYGTSKPIAKLLGNYKSLLL